MLIPIGTDRPLSRGTIVNHVLIALNLVVAAWGVLLGQLDPELLRQAEEFLALTPGRSGAWTYLTYAFVHAGAMHLVGNMVFLWVFGPNVEDRLGRVGYLGLYLAGAAGAGGLHAALERGSVVGASGAIAAVTGVYLVLFPRTMIRLFVLFVFMGRVLMPAWVFIGARIAWDLILEGSGSSGRTATWAHLGGYALGISVAMVLLWTRILKRETYDLFSISRQAIRRRELREASRMHERRAPRPEVRPTGRAAKDPPKEDPGREALAHARAEVSRRIAVADWEGASAAYRALLAGFGNSKAECVLPRRHQYDLANQLYSRGELTAAVSAYAGFLDRYASDPEAPLVRLLLGRLYARELNDPIAAKALLAQAIEGLKDEATLEMARRDLAELG